MEALNAIPTAFSFSPASSWQQLENRLQKKPSKRIGWLYWAAASLLIILSSMFVLLQEKKQAATVSTKGQPQKIETGISIVQEQPTAQKQVPLKQVVPINKQQKTVVINTNKAIAPITVNNEPIVTVVPAVNNTLAETQNVAATVVEYKAENAMAVTNNNAVQQSNAAKKTRMKIVHLNEMGQEQQQPVALTNAALKKAIHQQDEMEIQPLEQNKSWWLFKTKPAATNTSKTINR